MKFKEYTRFSSILFILFSFHCINYVFGQAPVAEKIKKVLITKNNKRIDNYYWINDGKNPKINEYLIAENEYLIYMLKPAENLQNKLYNEMVIRKDNDVTSVPYKDNGYLYYTRFYHNKQYKVYFRIKDSLNAKEELLFDANELAIGKKDFSITAFGLSISPDNRLLAFGYESYEGSALKFRDLTTGEWLKDEINGVTGDPVWANDNKTVFYSVTNMIGMSNKVKKHILGENPKKDKIVYSEKNPAFYVYLYKSKSHKYIFLKTESYITSEFRILNADSPSINFRLFQPRKKGMLYYIEHLDKQFYVLTNYQAKNYRVMVTPEYQTTKENWKELVPGDKDIYIYNIEPFKNFIVLNVMKDGLSQVLIIDLKTGVSHYIVQDDDIYTIMVKMVIISYNHDPDTEWLRYEYSSLTSPDCIILYNMRTKEKKIIGSGKLAGGYNPTEYEMKRVWATAHDSTKIPISLVYKKGLELNGQNPLLLTGYGGGGMNDVSFSSDRICLLDRGFVYAIAHIRGDEDLGDKWHEDGKLLNKKNTFTDFISCAEYLIDEGYTNPQKLFAQGGSAGGMLMGVVVNMKPELFKGIIANSPFMDVVTVLQSRQFSWAWDEYGNPRKKKYYHYILSYSPYDNITAKNYPAMLLTTGIDDYYWIVAKYTAKLRALKTDNNLLLLHTNMSAGHLGPTGKLEAMRETALEYAFLLNLLGIKE